jgi:cold shock CspA family protein
LDGRITYQQNGESFYIPYSLGDVLMTQQPVNLGDRVKFNVAVNSFGIYYACRIEPAQQLPKQLYRGIITSLKDTFGKIEREDLLRETFFHFTEYKGVNANDELKLGLNVEFEIQVRYGKEIATNITMLPDGTVCFDELSPNVFIGRIVQAPIRLTNGSVTLGRLLYDSHQESLTELTFSDTDRIPTNVPEYSNKYTLLEGDFVQFRIASDKRRKFQTQTNNIQRATHVTLIEEHSLVQNFMNTGEQREKGILIKISDLISNSQQQQQKYGAIKCLEREDLIYFAFSEVINYARFKADSKSFVLNQVKLEVGDSLEFSVIQCQPVSFIKFD